MLKRAMLTLIALVIAIGGGAASVWYALHVQKGAGAIGVGSWTAFPDIGTPQADPYTNARVAREGVLALGRAEGLAFVAEHDSGGRPLTKECTYRLEGHLPIARFWTLYAADRSLDVIKTGKSRPAALQSYQVVREPDNSVRITASRHPAPGNWLLTAGSGAMYFVLTFYDTPIASSTGLSGIELPRIVRSGCDA
ncbi:DUF1214 domain-containing protein [Aquamicrobium ahrensii]|uniref:DUF1214 domain-containing protein n=1 Tax=Aquamicrobium ahrensii TaxID=469551 RepID=A0ABV2KNG6_9HYPH